MKTMIKKTIAALYLVPLVMLFAFEVMLRACMCMFAAALLSPCSLAFSIGCLVKRFHLWLVGRDETLNDRLTAFFSSMTFKEALCTVLNPLDVWNGVIGDSNLVQLSSIHEVFKVVAGESHG